MAGARRWAIPLARILRFAGYDVTTEYYINDAGRQMRLLGLSIWLRAKELAGIAVNGLKITIEGPISLILRAR